MRYLSLIVLIYCLPAFSDMPTWMDSPEDAGYDIAIIGSAMPQKMGERAQRKMAELSARREFSANKDTYIKSIQKNHEDSQGKQHFESQSYLNSGGLLSFSSMNFIDEWKDEETGELFFLYAIGQEK